MPEFYKSRVPIIRRSLNEGFIRGTPDAEPARGCVPRDYAVDPVLMGDSPAGIQLYDDSEYDAIYDEQEAQESSLEHLYLRGGKPAFEFLDQNGFPDCWCHSTAHTMMLDRLKQNLPVLRFNAVAMATMMRQLNGGWCGKSMKWARDNGCPVIGTGPGEWPYQTRSNHDTPELRANMLRHKAEEDWYDLGREVWDQTLAKRQLSTLGSSNVPAAVDYNDYSHSMAMVRRVRIERNAWGDLILNSWQGFGHHGLCVIPDTTTRPNNAVALRASTPSSS